MVEIYRETLYDLLNDRAYDLKIKENPRKGIYIEGLNEINRSEKRGRLNLIDLAGSEKVIGYSLDNYEYCIGWKIRCSW